MKKILFVLTLFLSSTLLKTMQESPNYQGIEQKNENINVTLIPQSLKDKLINLIFKELSSTGTGLNFLIPFVFRKIGRDNIDKDKFDLMDLAQGFSKLQTKPFLLGSVEFLKL